jgi:guanidinopropionase
MNQATGVRPFDSCRCETPLDCASLDLLRPQRSVADIGDAWVERTYGLPPLDAQPPAGAPPAEPRDSLRWAHDEITHFYNAVADAGVSPITAGGDHSISLPILRALRRAVGRPLAMVHFDAHMDTAPPDEVAAAVGSRYPNYTPFSCAAQEGLIDPQRVIQIGIRGPASGGRMLSRELGFRVVEMEEFYDKRARAIAAEARALVGDAPCYITFDVDALDPAYALGTGSPEDGGLTTLEAQIVLRGLRGANIVGTDFVCTSPLWGARSLAAALLR